MAGIVLYPDSETVQTIDASTEAPFSCTVELKGDRLLSKALLYAFHRTRQAHLLEGEPIPVGSGSAREVTLELQKEDLIWPGILEVHVIAVNSDGTTQRYPGEGMLRISVTGETRRYELGMLTRAIEEAMRFRNEAETFSRAKADGTVVKWSRLPPASEHEAEIWFAVDTRQYYKSDGVGWSSVGTATAGITSDGELTDVPVARVATIAGMQATRPTPNMHRIVEGYSDSSQSGGGLFKWVAGDRTPPNGGLVFESTVSGYRSGEANEGRWHRMWDSQNMQLSWFGAKSEDTSAVLVNDDALERALNAAPDHTRLVLDGSYYIQSGHQINRPVTIAEGCLVISVPNSLDRLFNVSSSEVIFEKVRFNGLDNDIKDVIGLHAGSSNCSILDCTFENFDSSTKHRTVHASNSDCEGFQVIGCIFRNLRAEPSGSKGDTDGICRAINIGISSTITGHPTTSVIRGCHFENIQTREGSAGIRTMALRDPIGVTTLIEGNTFINVGRRCVKAQSKRTFVYNNVMISDVQVARSGVNLQCGDSSACGNVVFGQFEWGINISDSGKNCLIEGNHICINSASEDLVSGNSACVQVASDGGNSIFSNKFCGGRFGVVVVADVNQQSEHNKITGNYFEGHLAGAIKFRTRCKSSYIIGIDISDNYYEGVMGQIVRAMNSENNGVIKRISITGDHVENVNSFSVIQFTGGGAADITIKDVYICSDPNCSLNQPIYLADTKRVVVDGCTLIFQGDHQNRFVQVNASRAGSLDKLLVTGNILDSGVTDVVYDASGGNATNITTRDNHIWG